MVNIFNSAASYLPHLTRVVHQAGVNLNQFSSVTIRSFNGRKYFSQSSSELKALSSKFLVDLNVFDELAEFDRRLKSKNDETTSNEEALKISSASTFYWNKKQRLSINLSKNGDLKLINSDKGVLIHQLFQMMKDGSIGVNSRIAIINEGADNGDFLGLVVPALINRGAEKIEISLINGNEDKLNLAHHFSSLLVGKNFVDKAAIDSFEPESGSKIVDKFKGIQQFHLPFRLVIVQRPEKVYFFLRDRISRMKQNDIMVASFLELNDLSVNLFLKMKFRGEISEPGSFMIFKKEASPRIKEMLSEQDPKEQFIYNTAFSYAKVGQLVRQVGGKILKMTTIKTTTDEGAPINTIGVILSKS